MSDTVLSGRLGPIDRPGLVTWSVQSESSLSGITTLPDGTTPITGDDVGRVAKVTGGDRPRYFELATFSAFSGNTWHEIGGSPSGEDQAGPSIPTGYIRGLEVELRDGSDGSDPGAYIFPGSLEINGMIYEVGAEIGPVDGSAGIASEFTFYGIFIQGNPDGTMSTYASTVPVTPGPGGLFNMSQSDSRLIGVVCGSLGGTPTTLRSNEDGWQRFASPIFFATASSSGKIEADGAIPSSFVARTFELLVAVEAAEDGSTPPVLVGGATVAGTFNQITIDRNLDSSVNYADPLGTGLQVQMNASGFKVRR